MDKKRIIIYLMIPILLITGGWVLFNAKIRPNHYQLLMPYSIFTAERLSVTQSRAGRDGCLEILIPQGRVMTGKDSFAAELSLDDFWIDQVPVTAGDYKKFISETKELAPRYHDEYAKYWLEKQYEILPAVFVSWGQAEAYCEYYGGHLPTEAQWEKAARGENGIILYWDDSGKAFDKANYDGFFGGKTPSGWLPKGKTVYGVLDMAGNVREWVLDWLIDEKQKASAEPWEMIRDQNADDAGRILKGGAYGDDVSHLRLNTRDAHAPNSPGINRGFRCVYEAE